jgi:hypothetical protein
VINMKKSELKQMIKEELLNEASKDLSVKLYAEIQDVITKYSKNKKLRAYASSIADRVTKAVVRVENDELAIGELLTVLGKVEK